VSGNLLRYAHDYAVPEPGASPYPRYDASPAGSLFQVPGMNALDPQVMEWFARNPAALQWYLRQQGGQQ
jgi:hypothetical protein